MVSSQPRIVGKVPSGKRQEEKDAFTVGGDGGSGGGMEARLAVLEEIAASTKEILSEIRIDMRELRQDQKTDFRITFGALITVAIGLAGLMAHGFKWF